jgi:hypothetical protein
MVENACLQYTKEQMFSNYYIGYIRTLQAFTKMALRLERINYPPPTTRAHTKKG